MVNLLLMMIKIILIFSPQKTSNPQPYKNTININTQGIYELNKTIYNINEFVFKKK